MIKSTTRKVFNLSPPTTSVSFPISLSALFLILPPSVFSTDKNSGKVETWFRLSSSSRDFTKAVNYIFMPTLHSITVILQFSPHSPTPTCYLYFCAVSVHQTDTDDDFLSDR